MLILALFVNFCFKLDISLLGSLGSHKTFFLDHNRSSILLCILLWTLSQNWLFRLFFLLRLLLWWSSSHWSWSHLFLWLYWLNFFYLFLLSGCFSQWLRLLSSFRSKEDILFWDLFLLDLLLWFIIFLWCLFCGLYFNLDCWFLWIQIRLLRSLLNLLCYFLFLLSICLLISFL